MGERDREMTEPQECELQSKTWQAPKVQAFSVMLGNSAGCAAVSPYPRDMVMGDLCISCHQHGLKALLGALTSWHSMLMCLFEEQTPTIWDCSPGRGIGWERVAGAVCWKYGIMHPTDEARRHGRDIIALVIRG